MNEEQQELFNTVNQGGIGRITNIANLNVQSKASNEVEAIMNVITYLSAEVEKVEEPLELTKERDWNKKINDRFVEYKPQIMVELETLIPLYKDKYKLAWNYSGVGEGRRDEIDALLSIRSRHELDKSGQNPLSALDALTNWLCTEASKSVIGEKTYSEAAIRFFLYTEFQRCNIFPNEINSNAE
jgi:hypothetical protein